MDYNYKEYDVKMQYDSLLGKNIRLRTILIIFTIIFNIVSGISIFFAVKFYNETKYPYIITINNDGQVLNNGRVSYQEFTVNQSMVESYAFKLINSYRKPYIDLEDYKKNTRWIYYFTTREIRDYLFTQDYLKDVEFNDSVERFITYIGSSWESSNRFRLRWAEDSINLGNKVKTYKIYEAYFDIEIKGTPTNKNDLLTNPLGLMFKNINIKEVINSGDMFN